MCVKTVIKKLKCSLTVFSLLILVLLFVSSLFFYNSTFYFSSTPLKLTSQGLPKIDVAIEHQKYPFILDTASFFPLKIYSEVLKKHTKVPQGRELWQDSFGRHFEPSSYKIPKLKIGNLSLNKLLAAEFPENMELQFFLWKKEGEEPSGENAGSIGNELLKKYSTLIDVEKKRFIFTNDLKRLRKEGYDLDTFVRVPFKCRAIGFFIQVETDLGRLHLMLDTGCPKTVIHEFFTPHDMPCQTDAQGHAAIETSTFEIEGVNFGKQTLHLIPMQQDVNNFDGFLGMDFIKDHVMYIDFPTKTVYIQP